MKVNDSEFLERGLGFFKKGMGPSNFNSYHYGFWKLDNNGEIVLTGEIVTDPYEINGRVFIDIQEIGNPSNRKSFDITEHRIRTISIGTLHLGGDDNVDQTDDINPLESLETPDHDRS